MTTTLYRKYRPKLFGEVVGQEHVTTTLQHQITTGKVAHAYLFCGTRGVGKTTVARLLAKSLNCTGRAKDSAEPCNACISCDAIAQGRSLDLIEIDAASNRRIDDVRELREHIPYGPTNSQYKVVIIDEVHMLTSEAYNALLKILEEPPAHVVFVLATTEVHKLPDTITSRCQRYDFRRLSPTILTARLAGLAKAEGVDIDMEVLRDVSYLARGSSRDAESYLGKLISLGERHIDRARADLVLPHTDQAEAQALLGDIVGRRTSSAVQRLNTYFAEGGELEHLHRQLLEWLRLLLLVKVGGKQVDIPDIDAETKIHLSAMAAELSQSRAKFMLERWLEASDSWRTSDVPQLPLELAIITLTESPGATDYESPAMPATAAEQKPTERKPTNGAESLETVQQRWPEVVQKIRSYNHSLSFILSIARPAAIEGNTLTVATQYPLHQDRIQDPKVKRAIEQALDDVTGTQLKLKVRLDQAPAGGDLLSSVLTTFEGQVVE